MFMVPNSIIEKIVANAAVAVAIAVITVAQDRSGSYTTTAKQQQPRTAKAVPSRVQRLGIGVTLALRTKDGEKESNVGIDGIYVYTALQV
nr:hypothetical protein CFP56_02889 [Quercus suber]